MWNLREHRKSPDRLSDVLPWAVLVTPGVVLNKDGSFLSTIAYRGPDLESATKEELLVNASHVNNIIRRLGSNWALFFEAQRVASDNYSASLWPDPISDLIDQERLARFNSHAHFESNYYLSLVYLPPQERTTRVLRSLFDVGAQHEIDYETFLDHFVAEANKVVDLLARIFPEVRFLTEGELLGYLHSTVSIKSHPIGLPDTPVYLDALLADTPLLGGFKPKLGEETLAVISVMGYPPLTYPSVLDAINNLSIEYRWGTRYIALDRLTAKKELEEYKRKWFAKRKNVQTLIKELLTKEESALFDSDAVQKAADVDAALLELGNDDVAYGYLTTTIILKNVDEDTLNAHASEIERILNGAGFSSRRETVNAVDAWLGTIPGNSRNNVRRPLLNTLNIAHLMPGASALWSGEKSSHLGERPLLVAETGGATPFRLNLHVGDVGHTLILGPTGAGKSTLLNLLAAQFLKYDGAQVYIFDKGCSALTLTLGVGGDHYELGADARLSFQPLSAIDREAEKTWAHEWILAIIARENVTVTPEVKHHVWAALESLSSSPVEQRTLHSLMVFLQDKSLRAAIEPFTTDGPYGGILDNSFDNLKYGTWQCFEMEQLMESPAVVAPVLSYLFHRLEERLSGAPTLIVLDEAWLFLDHPAFSAKIREWLKTFRKKNASVVFATQSLSDVDASSIAPTIKEACFTKIYLPNSVALQPDSRQFYKSFGLNERQIEILAHAFPKRDYYYTSPLGNRLFQLGMGDISLAYCAGASKERQALIRNIQVRAVSRGEFNVEFLAACGLNDAASRVSESSTLRNVA